MENPDFFFSPVWEEQRRCANEFQRALENSSKGPGGFGAGLRFGGGSGGKRRREKRGKFKAGIQNKSMPGRERRARKKLRPNSLRGSL